MKKAIFHVLIFFLALHVSGQIVPRTNLRIAEGRYMVQLTNGRAMEAESNTYMNNGARVQIWLPYYALNQLWDIRDAGDGKYYFIDVASGKVLQAGNFTAIRNGSPVQLWSMITGSDAQKWFLQGAGGGRYTIRCAAAGASDKILDVTGAVIDRGGAAIQLWDNLNGSNQVWSLTRSSDSAIVGRNFVNLSKNQTALKNQAIVSDRGGCTYYGNTATLEAAYKKRGYGELDLSEEFFSIMAKVLYIHPYWDQITNSNYRENQIGGLQGGGDILWFTTGLKIPTERFVPYKRGFTAPSYWDTRDQRLASQFNAGLLIDSVIKAPLYYGASGGVKFTAAQLNTPAEYERVLSLGYEVDVSINGGEHNIVIVGFDKTDPARPYFYVKDSYGTPGTRCFNNPDKRNYTDLLPTVTSAGYITEIRIPAAFPELAFLGRWNLDFDGHRGMLDIYHIPGITSPGLLTNDGGTPVTDRRIGDFYDEAGNAFRVNGTISGNMITFYFDLSSPNQRWDELLGRRFTYYLDPTQDIMSGFHRDGDGSTYGGYAIKRPYVVHNSAEPLLDRLVNNDWGLKWGDKSGNVRFTAGEDGTRSPGTFNYGTGTSSVIVSYDGSDHSTIRLQMGTQTARIKFLNHEQGMLCGYDPTQKPVILYKR